MKYFFQNIFLLLALAGCNTKKQADLIVYNAVVYTVDSSFTTQEAFAVKDGIILAAGNSAEIQSKYQAQEMYDAKGQPVYPGFIDAHCHFLSYGKSLFSVELYGCSSEDEMIERVNAFAEKNPQEKWIFGRGWDQNLWPGKQFPTNKKLNELFPGKPVLLERVDGHASLANAAALSLANMKPGMQIAGGSAETKDGKLTGILIDNAIDTLNLVIPKPSKADHEKWLMAAQKNCFAQGLTTVTDCGLMYNEVEDIDALQKEKKLQMRIYVMLSDNKLNYEKYIDKPPYKTDLLYVRGIKVYGDGALGSRGACLLDDYSDQKDWKGFLLQTQSHYDSIAKMLAGTDFQMCTHAIGDSANRVILNIYNKYLQGKNDKRWRIEHAQIIQKNDFDLFGNASIIPSVQSTHATSDMYWAAERLGNERIKGAYAFKQLLQQNGWIALGTDFPVEDISPFKTFLASVFRKDAKGYPAQGFQTENALSREETIRGMTIWAAKAAFLEKEIGSIEPGKKADFIILDKDLMKINEQDILQAKVLATYSNGKKVY